MSTIKDHFSKQATSYARFRPSYPDELFNWLASQCSQQQLAWDCACGNGQAATALALYFDAVVATDGSEKQIAQATPHDKISYLIEAAENTSLKDHSVDLITVAQAFHWFDFDAFFDEVKRVLKPDGLLAIWTYNSVQIVPEIDYQIFQLYEGLLSEFWPPERKLVEQGYADIEFPFNYIESPEFSMHQRWNFDQLKGYITSWSAYNRYLEQHDDAIPNVLMERIASSWGDLNQKRLIKWPLTLRVFSPHQHSA